MGSNVGDSPTDSQNNIDSLYNTDNREPQEMDMEQSEDEETTSRREDDDDGVEVENGNPELKRQYDNRLHENNYDDDHQNHQRQNHHRRNHDHHSHRLHKNHEGDLHDKSSTNIIQVTNISPSATIEQISILFGFLGDILHAELYQSDQNPDNNFKVCFVEFAKSSSVLLAQHLTNTVFIDRAIVVVPYYQSKTIPERDTAVAGVLASNLVNKFNCGVVNQATTATGGAQVVATIDPRLTALGLPQYPQLPINTDPARIEEIRRTVYIGNLDSTLPPDQVLKFFNGIGEVKYIRMAGDDTQPTRFAFVEFTHQSSVASALQHNGFKLGSRPLKINHSNNAIVKPQLKTEVDETLKRSRDTRSSSRDLDFRDRRESSRYTSGRDRERDRDRDRYHVRRSSRDYKSSRRSSRSRDREVIPRRRSRSRDRISRRSRSREKISRSRRSRSRDSKRRRSRSRSKERSSKQKHHKSSRR